MGDPTESPVKLEPEVTEVTERPSRATLLDVSAGEDQCLGPKFYDTVRRTIELDPTGRLFVLAHLAKPCPGCWQSIQALDPWVGDLGAVADPLILAVRRIGSSPDWLRANHRQALRLATAHQGGICHLMLEEVRRTARDVEDLVDALRDTVTLCSEDAVGLPALQEVKLTVRAELYAAEVLLEPNISTKPGRDSQRSAPRPTCWVPIYGRPTASSLPERPSNRLRTVTNGRR